MLESGTFGTVRARFDVRSFLHVRLDVPHSMVCALPGSPDWTSRQGECHGSSHSAAALRREVRALIASDDHDLTIEGIVLPVNREMRGQRAHVRYEVSSITAFGRLPGTTSTNSRCDLLRPRSPSGSCMPDWSSATGRQQASRTPTGSWLARPRSTDKEAR